MKTTQLTLGKERGEDRGTCIACLPEKGDNIHKEGVRGKKKQRDGETTCTTHPLRDDRKKGE